MILVVEDNEGLRRLTMRILASAGYTVLGADSGEAALDLLATQDGAVRLVLTDVVMPGMGGRRLVESLAETHPGIKAIYMSGYTSDTIVRHGILEGQLPFINKPFTPSILLDKVRETLNSTP